MNDQQEATGGKPPTTGADRARKIFFFHRAVGAFLFSMIFPILTVYYVQNVGMDPLQLVLVGTVLEATAFLFEVPTGVVADTFSRKLSIIIGVFLHGVSFLLTGSIPLFLGILFAQVVSGLAWTFASGATEAWVAGEVGEEAIGPVFLRASQFSRVGAAIGIVTGVGLASITITLPIMLGGLLFIALGIFEIFAMPETGFKSVAKEDRESPLKAMRTTLVEGTRVVRVSPILVMFIAIGFFFGMTSEGIDRLGDAHFLKNFSFPSLGNLQPIVWFGIIEMGILILGIFCTEVLRRRLDMQDHSRVAKTLIVFSGLRILMVSAFALAGDFYMALLAFWAAALLRSLSGPLYETWLTVSIPQRVRATVLSMTSQSDAIGQVAGGPVIGWIGTAVSIRAALVTSALLLSPALLLYAKARDRVEEGQSGGSPAEVAPVLAE